MSTIRVEVVSAEAEIFKGEAKLVVVSGEMGDLGIAPRHAPLITRIKPGQVRIIKPDDDELFLYVSGGILEVQPTVVTILADSAVRAADLDEAVALQAKQNAEAAIANRTDAVEVAKAQVELAQSMAQLQALERLRKTLKH
ncbi:MAG: F0F1 ATP synthase subunit epsilon [Rhodanobacteraceae bacterium]|nr:F0F1 ATP synthase subunit epsilon [Rhodanobacteraceae bacterium]